MKKYIYIYISIHKRIFGYKLKKKKKLLVYIKLLDTDRNETGYILDIFYKLTL